MSLHLKVNYIVAFYIGANRQNPYYKKFLDKDKLYFVKKHLDFLQKVNYFVQPTFVVNNDIEPSTLEQLIQLVSNTPVQLVLRENSGFSYGAWCDVIERNIDKDFDYFFLIEDDYIPSTETFLEPFITKCKDKVCYVCSLAHKVSSKNNKNVSDADGEFYHPSISNGILSSACVKEIYKKYNRALRIKPGVDHDTGYINQLYFLKDYTDEGFEVTDIIDTHSSPFMNSLSQTIVVYGDPSKPAVLYPI